MSVHKEITKHVNKQNRRITKFMALDQQREYYIEQALQHCREGKPFTADDINEVTTRINDLAKQGIPPRKKLVTIVMIEKYAGRKK
ncbi:DUF2533 family protein [Cytobacillus depressus]|uniref:DUF2533 family protein n=1 Tax=Cytobacillus depressus TaxID=1602942 RepID=A0A6L3V545_9BACI|nr:DUF2533 family protein [Cytobacillus depressus]KAB2330198.1 DUF2533 family protein [Cytobacillus depressus]